MTSNKKKMDLSKIDTEEVLLNSKSTLKEIFDLFDNGGNQSITYHEINRKFISLNDKKSTKKVNLVKLMAPTD